MIDALDRILMDFIQSNVSALAGPMQIGFAPPNDDWRMNVASGNTDRLNIYLYDLREDLKLRSNDRTVTQANGWSTARRAPPLLDCWYLITAWSPVIQTPGVEPSLDEHQLLGAVAEVLFRHRSIRIADVYGPAIPIPSHRTIASVPGPLQTEELPLEVGPTDPSQELLEFWSSMRAVWRPSLKVKIAFPIFPMVPDFESPMVTTLIADHRQWDVATASEVLHSFGGTVSSGNSPVARAYVRALGKSPAAVQMIDRHVITLDDGRFVFSALRAGSYELTVSAPGLGPKVRQIDLPSQTGEYDVHFP